MPLNNIGLTGPFQMPALGVTNLPGGGLVRYVYQDSSGNGITSLSGLPSGLADISDLTLVSAMAKCRANRGDAIVILENHVETVGAGTLTPIAGVTVFGRGNGDERPTFNWTAATSAIASAVANFRISNCILNLAATAATATTKALAFTGARNIIDNCKIVAGAAGGTQQATIGIELATGADRFQFLGNKVIAPTDAAVPTLIKLTNAVDYCEFLGNDIDVGMSATTGSLITFTTAPTNIRIGGREGPYQGNKLRNSIASSTIVLTGVANSTGWIDNNICAIEAASGAASSITVPGNMHLGLNYTSVPGKYGILTGTVST